MIPLSEIQTSLPSLLYNLNADLLIPSLSVYNPINGSDGYPFASLFFHELGETFLYDAENCVTRFDSENFQKIMRLAKLYEEEGNQANAEDFLHLAPAR